MQNIYGAMSPTTPKQRARSDVDFICILTPCADQFSPMICSSVNRFFQSKPSNAGIGHPSYSYSNWGGGTVRGSISPYSRRAETSAPRITGGQPRYTQHPPAVDARISTQNQPSLDQCCSFPGQNAPIRRGHRNYRRQRSSCPHHTEVHTCLRPQKQSGSAAQSPLPH